MCEMFIGRSFERRMLPGSTRRSPISGTASRRRAFPPSAFPRGSPDGSSRRGGEYKIVVKHNDGARLWIDGKPYIDNWMMGEATDEATVELSAAYHELRLEYQQGEGGSHLTLAWATPGDPSITPIPPEGFFHEPLDIPEQLQTLLEPEPDGTLHLTAAFADPHGQGARYIDDDGSSPGLSGFGTWKVYASWDVVVAEGKYAVELTFSCDNNSAGGEFLVTVAPRDSAGPPKTPAAGTTQRNMPWAQ